MFDDSLRKIALSNQALLEEAEEKFDRSYWTFMDSVAPFDYKDPKFWNFVAKLSERCVKGQSVESACHNTFCYWPDEDITDALRSVVTIDKIKGELYEPLFGVTTDKGDDGYGDLLDAFFLAGPTLVNEALAGTYTVGDEDELKKRVLDQCGAKIVDIIWNGENYFHMCLEKPAKVWLGSAVLPKEEVKELKEPTEGKFWHETF